MGTVFLIFEIIGTVAFAISGAMEGIRRDMDLFGILMLGLVTAVGGGVVRDVIIGYTPPAAFRHPYCAVIALVVGAFAVNTSAGGAALVVLGLVCLTRYLSLATVAEAIVLIMVAVLIIDDALLMRLLIFSAVLVIFKHIPAMIRLMQGKEFRYSLEEDITYKLDERF